MKHLHPMREVGLRGYARIRQMRTAASVSIVKVKRFTRQATVVPAKVSAMTANQHPELSDADRETYIKQCGLMLQQAVAQGQCDLARYWLEQQKEAIFQRSPEQQAWMIAEIERRISESMNSQRQGLGAVA